MQPSMFRHGCRSEARVNADGGVSVHRPQNLHTKNVFGIPRGMRYASYAEIIIEPHIEQLGVFDGRADTKYRCRIA